MKNISHEDIKLKLEPIKAVATLLSELVDAQHYEASGMAAKRLIAEINQFSDSLEVEEETEKEPEKEPEKKEDPKPAPEKKEDPKPAPKPAEPAPKEESAV